MTDTPYDFSRRVRCDADNLAASAETLWKEPQKIQDVVDSLRDLANEYDSIVARLTAANELLRQEIERLKGLISAGASA